MDVSQDAFEQAVLQRLGAQDRVMSQQGDLLEEIRQNTNGRLRSLEEFRAKIEGARMAVGWVPPLLTAIIGSGAGAVIVLLFH